ncbi:hypothetical protein [uncultured phage cr7_1]|uniref:Uncharacterized protein n=1 Tax=uncultured phage cr7_1 TaxID=2772086 RepID=A0A7M1RS57_9CAUD|nr:tail protein [uncultured phage cr7_1]QOR57277.1 hypothetical protein [uncultured phage cr7_1]
MILEKDFLYRVPIKNVLVTAPGKLIRNPKILVDLEGGEFMHGDILDANSTNKLIDQSVKDAIDNSIENGNYVTKDLLEAETSARTKSDEDLSAKIKAEQTRAEGKEKEISDKLAIVDGDSNTEGSFRKAISTKADATALSNYVLTTALNLLIDTLNAAISDKLDAGNYVPYTLLSGDGYEMEIGFVYNYTTPGNAHITTLIGGDISMSENNGPHTYISAGLVSVMYPMKGYIDITPESITGGNRSDLFHFKLNENGVLLRGGDNNHVLTSNGSTIDITQYALKTELPDVSIDMLSYGVEWDITVADPTCTRIGNPLFHKSLPILSEYKGCVVKNGKLLYYLNPNDWSKKSNGEPSHLDGTDGDVMIRTPRFYGKSGSNGNKRWVRISTVQIDASWTEIPEMFISAYRNTIYTDSDTTKVASVVSTDAKYRGGGRRSAYDEYLATDLFKTDLGKPVSNISRETMRTYAAATGQELLCYEFYKWIFYWNYVIEYANFNSLKEFNSELTSDGYHLGGLGPGLTTFDWNIWNTYNKNYAITPCGYTNEFGNFSGVKAILLQSPEKTLYANRWRGFENPFGDIWTNLEGIVIKRDAVKANSNVYTTTDVLKYGDDYSLFDIAGVEIAQDGYIGTFDLGSKAEIIPSSITGSESTYKCDYHSCNADSIVNRTLLVGGHAYFGGAAGLGSFYSADGVSHAHATVGFRSLVRV